MKHLHYVQSLEPLQGAGLGYAALGMHQGLLAAGKDSKLVATRESGFKQEWPGVEQFDRVGPAKLFYAPGLGESAAALVREADVLHGHGFYAYPSMCLGREVRRQKKLLVYHVHGFLDPWILRRSRLKKRLVRWLFEDANFQHVGLWRALTEREKAQIRDYGIEGRVEVLPNGVQLPPERSAEEVAALAQVFPKKKAKRLVFLSRIHPKKGIDLLLAAVAGLRSECRDWEVALFGPDEGGYLTTMQDRVRDLELEEMCTFYGSVSGREKEAALRSADLFVLPSYSEGFPMAVLEAAAQGVPVVQTSECNFPELTAAGGAWEGAPTVEALTTALREALSADDAERSQRGQRGRALVARDYNWESIALRLEEACAETLKLRNAEKAALRGS